MITSPKRDKSDLSGWEGFFPYYAGFPTRFAKSIIRSAHLAPRSSVLDPWNGSGTTTHAAAQLGHIAIGFDLNPVMVVIARARTLSPKDADSLLPLCNEIIRGSRARTIRDNDPLLSWFDSNTAVYIRAIEQSIQRCLVGTQIRSNLDRLSSMAATFYAVLFSVCRDLTATFQSSNPTWIRLPRTDCDRITAGKIAIATLFTDKVKGMSDALLLEEKKHLRDLIITAYSVGDSTEIALQDSSIDLILGSPPYCTRIDYTASTRVELAVLSTLVHVDVPALGRRMIGSTRVPELAPAPQEAWGPTCLNFIDRLRVHKSKASSGYYYKTHVDYFDKMFRSIRSLSTVLRPMGQVVLVVQDSYYKEIHNPLPEIFREMANSHGLELSDRGDFPVVRSMASVNSASIKYKTRKTPIESVLCFRKN